MVLEVNNISKIYKNKRGIKDITFSVDESEIFGLLGPNGSGKTTIMKVITGLIKPQKGTVEIFGSDIVENTSEALQYVGSLIESPSSINYMSAYENLKIVRGFYENPMDIDEVLDLVGMSKYKKEKVSKFSLGMKQRMGLALSLIGSPKLLVFDEPTNGLDIEGTVEIRNMIKRLAVEKNVTVLISSHLSSELQQICTKVAIMKDCMIVSTENLDVVLENHPSLEDYFLHVVKNKKEVLN